MSRRLWCKAQVHGGTIRVYLTTYKPDDGSGDKCDGTFDSEKGEIEIDASLSDDKAKMTLLHELLHVCFGGASGQLRENVLGAKTPEARATREEMVVSFIEPVLYDLLVRNGWLRFPKPRRAAK